GYSEMRGVVRDTDGAAIPGALVCALELGGFAPNTPCVLTGGSGQFGLQGTSTERFLLHVSAPNHIARTVDVSPQTNGASLRESILVTLKHGGVQVTGSVVDATGGP